jgi:hypothetical protein
MEMQGRELVPLRDICPSVWTRYLLIRSWFRIHPRTAGIFRCGGRNGRVIQGHQVPSVMNQGTAHSKRCPSNVAGTMHPVRISGSRRRRANVDRKRPTYSIA